MSTTGIKDVTDIAHKKQQLQGGEKMRKCLAAADKSTNPKKCIDATRQAMKIPDMLYNYLYFPDPGGWLFGFKLSETW